MLAGVFVSKSVCLNNVMRCFILMISVVLSGCLWDQKNLLLGDWIVDDERTLRELKQQVDLPGYLKWIKCYEDRLCGNYAIRYTEREYFYLYPRNASGGFVKNGTAKYKIRMRDGSYERIDLNVGEKVEPVQITFTKDGYYISNEGRKEYLVRTSINNNQILSVE